MFIRLADPGCQFCQFRVSYSQEDQIVKLVKGLRALMVMVHDNIIDCSGWSFTMLSDHSHDTNEF